MPLGNPIRKQNESRMVSVLATEGQTVFTVQGGYIINHISVFRNGVRLSPAEDLQQVMDQQSHLIMQQI